MQTAMNQLCNIYTETITLRGIYVYVFINNKEHKTLPMYTVQAP